MSSKINKEQILEDILRTLVAGWGRQGVKDALERVGAEPRDGAKVPKPIELEQTEEAPQAFEYARSRNFGANQRLIEELAREYDEGKIFARNADIQNFLKSHGYRLRESKSRNQAFRLISSALANMSRKGVMGVIERARYSGPAKLEEVSEAIGQRAQASRRAGRD